MLLPSSQYSFHLPLIAEHAEDLLIAVTHKGQLLPDKYRREDELQQLIKFNGRINKGKFEVSPKVKHGQHFIPQLKGEIIDSGNGCIVSVKFELFFGSKVLFLLWNVVTFLLMIVFFIKGMNSYGIVALMFFILNNLVGYLNFAMHVRKCKDLLDEVFSL